MWISLKFFSQCSVRFPTRMEYGPYPEKQFWLYHSFPNLLGAAQTSPHVTTVRCLGIVCTFSLFSQNSLPLPPIRDHRLSRGGCCLLLGCPLPSVHIKLISWLVCPSISWIGLQLLFYTPALRFFFFFWKHRRFRFQALSVPQCRDE